MKVKCKKLHPDAKLPTYGSDGAGCFDLYISKVFPQKFDGNGLDPHTFGTGLAFEIPDRHVMLVFPRSSTGFKYNAQLVNGTGVIDSDYRGEVIVKLTKGIPAKVGDRIAQAIILPYDKVEFEEVDYLSITCRGDDGFGSTGK